jgi:hypothetical protein
MNAIKDPRDLCRVVQEIYKNWSGSKPQTTHMVDVTFIVFDSEDLNEFIRASKELVEQKIIYNYKEVEIKFFHDEELGGVYGGKYQYKLIPQKLINFGRVNSFLPIFTLSWNESQRKVLVNNKYVVTTTHFDSPAYYFFHALLEDTRKSISKKELLRTVGSSRKNIRFHKIIDDTLGKYWSKTFFPQISENRVVCRKEVMVRDLIDSNLKPSILRLKLKKLKTI